RSVTTGCSRTGSALVGPMRLRSLRGCVTAAGDFTWSGGVPALPPSAIMISFSCLLERVGGLPPPAGSTVASRADDHLPPGPCRRRAASRCAAAGGGHPPGQAPGVRRRRDDAGMAARGVCGDVVLIGLPVFAACHQ